MVYSLEIPIAMLLQTHDVLMLFVDEVMKFLPPVGATSHFNTVSILRRTALMRNSSASINGFLTDNEIIWEETILYNCLRDVEYWNIVEDHSLWGFIIDYTLRNNVYRWMDHMKDYICYRGLSAPVVRRPRKTNTTRKRLCPWTPGQLDQDVVLPMNESCQNTELLRMFCQGPWPASYAGFTRIILCIDEMFSTLRLSLEQEGDIASVIDLDHLYTTVDRGFRWHNIGSVKFAGRRLIEEPMFLGRHIIDDPCRMDI